eukprot:3368792-Pleurochrysis_carterae.AAC.1
MKFTTAARRQYLIWSTFRRKRSKQQLQHALNKKVGPESYSILGRKGCWSVGIKVLSKMNLFIPTGVESLICARLEHGQRACRRAATSCARKVECAVTLPPLPVGR